MIRKELISRSPLRILEKSIHGGVGPGDIAAIASPKGVGKTACLVHIATDQLLQEKHVIHVSYSGRTDHIISWYEDIFKEISRKKELEAAVDIHDEIIRNRVVLNFNQAGTKIGQVVRSLKAMIVDGGFAADLIVVDGFDFQRATPDELGALKEFLAGTRVSVWFSASLPPENRAIDERGVPVLLAPYLDHLSVLITLETRGDHVALRLVKDHALFTGEDMHLKLDPRTLLIAEED